MATREAREQVLRHAGFLDRVREAILGDDAPGGSAFAHLSEDASDFTIKSDWAVRVGDPDYTYTTPYFQIDTTLLETLGANATYVFLQAGVFGDTENRFGVHLDGSLHWGDGTAAPDVHLERSANANLVVPGPAYLIGEIGVGAGTDADLNNSTGTWSFLDPGGTVSFSNGTGTCVLSTDNAGNLLVNGAAVTVP